MSFERLNLNQPEKKKTSQELAIGHINLESEKIEKELKSEKRWGRVAEIFGGTISIVGVGCAAIFLEKLAGGASPEFANFIQNADLKNLVEFISSPEMMRLITAITNLGWGYVLLAGGKEKIRRAVEKAKEKKNRILAQYIQ